MSGVIEYPRFCVSGLVLPSGKQTGVVVSMDDVQTDIFLTRTQARRLAKGLLRESGRTAA